MKILKLNSKSAQKLYERNLYNRKKSIQEKVTRILDDVRSDGDDAVLKYTRRFDKAKLDAKDLRVAEGEISGAFQNITSDFIADLKTIIHNVTAFYKGQIQKP